MIHTVLESSVEMWKSFSAATEAHTLAQVISPPFTVITMITHNTSFDRNSLAGYKIFDASTDSSHDTPCFVT